MCVCVCVCLSQVFNDVELSVLGGCAVEDDGSGVWVKPSRMTLPQLRAELTYAGVPYDEETAKRKELSALVKVRDGLLRS